MKEICYFLYLVLFALALWYVPRWADKWERTRGKM